MIRVFKKENGEFKIEYDRTFEPYFYALLKDDSAIEDVKKVTAKRHGTVVKVKRAEKVQKKFLGRPIEGGNCTLTIRRMSRRLEIVFVPTRR